MSLLSTLHFTNKYTFPNHSIMPISGQISFRCSRQNGAVLVCDEVDGKDAHNILFYERYLLKNIEGWHAFVRSQDLPLEIEDLMLVTGRHLTSSWALAALSGQDDSASVELNVSFMGQAGTSLSGGLSWRAMHNAQENRGPRSRTLHTVISSDRDFDSSAPREPAISPSIVHTDEKNQCIFVRGMRAKKRSLWRGLKMKAAADPNHAGDDEDHDVRKAIFNVMSVCPLIRIFSLTVAHR